ncbi:MAG: MFS transporter [Candidatus Aenigmarchaeota archaeon]|nr:MFS transporter [Candidatus Aenigmarchaeota archaeon]
MHLSEYTKATGINVTFIFAISMLSPVLAPYIKSLGFDNIQLSLIFAVMPFMIIFSSPIIGRISDNIGRKNVILAGVLAEIVAICLYMFGTGSAAIIIARAIDAVAATAVSMAALAKIEDCVNDKTRGRYAGASLSIEYIGRLAGPVIGGLLADMIFVQAPFLAAILILAGLILFIPKKKIARKDIQKKELDLAGAIRTFLSYRELRGMAILGIVMHATFPAIMIFLPLLITESMGLSYVYVGYAYFAIGATHILQFVFGRWSDRKAYRTVLAGTFISGVFLALLSQAAAYPLILAILFLKGIGNSMWNVSAWTLMSNIGERTKTEGEIIGTYISIAKIGSLISFIASGFIVEIYDISTLFMLNGALIIIGTIIAYPLMKK